jgi:hypothetical protein
MAAPNISTETRLQDFIHAIEQGRFVWVMRVLITLTVLLAIALAYLGWNFRGFSRPEAMDQAQIAREISRGHGWSTKLIRPLAIWQMEKNNKPGTHSEFFPDTYNAPLPPLVNSLAVKLSGDAMKFERLEIVPTAERLIVILSMFCFLGAAAINYFLLARLFDQRLALWATGLMLLSDLCWQFTLSGLPQMLMLLLFSAAMYALTRALQAHLRTAEAPPPPEELIPTEDGLVRIEPRSPTAAILGWLAAAGVFFGLMALSHALSLSIFLGAQGFALIYFRGSRALALAMLATFLLVYAPWLVRTYQVSGNLFGVAGYALFDTINGSTAARMRSIEGPITEEVAAYFFRPKLEHGIVDQFYRLAQNLGGSLLALGFFASLLHAFRRPETGAMRWAVLSMWGGAAMGMALLGVLGEPMVGANQMGVLFLPVMLGFGLAFALVLFGRLEISESALARLVFFSGVFLLNALPMIVTLLPERIAPHQFPPYFPPAINRLNAWTNDKEIIGTDMPWGVAWYADRKSLWIPNKLRDFMGMSDQGKLNGTLAGMFLTPISRNAPFVTSIYKGEYQEYAQLVFGNVNLPYFPFRETALLIGDLNYTFYSDTRRWEKAAPAEP